MFPTLPARVRIAPLHRSEYSMTRMPLSAHIRRGVPLLTRVHLAIVANDSDAYTRGSTLFEGEKNLTLPCVGSEQHATPCTSQISPLSVVLPLLETSTRDTPPNESAAYERYAEDPNVENLKPHDPVIEELGEVGGVPSAPSDAPGLPEGLERGGLVCVAAGMRH
jgi:hypothetical protein